MYLYDKEQDERELIEKRKETLQTKAKKILEKVKELDKEIEKLVDEAETYSDDYDNKSFKDRSKWEETYHEFKDLFDISEKARTELEDVEDSVKSVILWSN